MKRFSIVSFLIGGVGGVLLGIAIGLFVFPFLFPPPAASEPLAQDERERVVATGTFVHANPSDPVHYGRGRVSVTDASVFLEDDFEVGPGPAYRVYLSRHPQVRTAADVTGAPFVNLGTLRSFRGSQRYAIPAGTNLADYPSVVIWCEEFGVLISPADLQRMAPQPRA